MLCDEHGKVAVCRDCATDLHSPYWAAVKSAAIHRRGTGHAVDVRDARELLKTQTGAKA